MMIMIMMMMMMVVVVMIREKDELAGIRTSGTIPTLMP
jgi:hypothetical protein